MFAGIYTVYKKYGIDPIQVWLERCRMVGLTPWITFRMNDCHCPEDDTCSLRPELFYEAKQKGWMIGERYGYYKNCLNFAVPEIRVLVQNAMLESALVLHKHYGADLVALQEHITDLLYRFTNKALKDTCQRVGGDPARKLSPADRLIGSSKLALEEGITPAYTAVGVAAGLFRYLQENGGVQSIDEAKVALSDVSNIGNSHPLFTLILHYYVMLLNGSSLSDLMTEADKLKHNSMQATI